MSGNAAYVQRIAAVDPVHADTMSRQPTTFQTSELPFYRKFKLVRALIRLRHRPLEFRYADDGSTILPLGGTEAHVYAINDKEALNLSEPEVGAYLRFYLANTEGRRRLVEQPTDVAWLPASNDTAPLSTVRASATAKIHPVQVTTASGAYRAVCTVVQAKNLLELTLGVAGNGRVRVQAQKVLVDQLPVPDVL